MPASRLTRSIPGRARSAARRTVVAALLLSVLPLAAAAQFLPRIPDPVRSSRIELDGPRVGITALSSGVRARLAEQQIEVGGMISQFGWQFERQFMGAGEGVAPVTELVLLVGGLDQGVFLPSVSWIVGLRTTGGTEFGVGPNITPAGSALAIALGTTIRQPAITIPITLAVVPSRSGTRVSLLTGWTMR